MWILFVLIAILIAGGAIYSKFIEKIFEPKDMQTPALVVNDGVDYVPMSRFKTFIIQFLNIAGTGPIYGPILGACFGPVVFLWIVIGCIIGGGVYDYFSGMMSVRSKGNSISKIISKNMGKKASIAINLLLCVMLLLLGAFFTSSSAGLLADLTPNIISSNWWTAIILLYFLTATFFPIDKIIGRIYPIFGIFLFAMAGSVISGLILKGYTLPTNIFVCHNPDGLLAIPNMLIAVACGAISGFHSTQAPLMARCIKNEKDGRITFYWAMIAEGIIALIWAAAALSYYGDSPDLMNIVFSKGQTTMVYEICESILGKVGTIIAIIGVVVCPISSGDTVFRSLRLMIADSFNIDQKNKLKRFLLALAVVMSGAVITQVDYTLLWMYFSWVNQIFATVVLWTIALYIYKHKGLLKSFIAIIPALFMSYVISAYYFESEISFYRNTTVGTIFGFAGMTLFFLFFLWRTKKVKKRLEEERKKNAELKEKEMVKE